MRGTGENKTTEDHWPGVNGVFKFYLVVGSPTCLCDALQKVLPVQWAIFFEWSEVALPFFSVGTAIAARIFHPELKLLLNLYLALSALQGPSITGSSSHPTGTGLGAILLVLQSWY